MPVRGGPGIVALATAVAVAFWFAPAVAVAFAVGEGTGVFVRTAVAVATGELPAQEAFITGRILLTGDQQALLGAQPVFGALDQVFSVVRDRTEYR